MLGTFCFDRDFTLTLNLTQYAEYDPHAAANYADRDDHSADDLNETPARRSPWDPDYRPTRSRKIATLRSWRKPRCRKGKPVARKIALRLPVHRV